MSLNHYFLGQDEGLNHFIYIKQVLNFLKENVTHCSKKSHFSSLPSCSCIGLAVRLLMCFALNRNLAKLMDVRQSDTSLSALNGIRVISMFWVILGHTVIFSITFGATGTKASGVTAPEPLLSF